MKNFLSENSKVIFKFLMTHIVMSILGIMVGLAVLQIEGETTDISPIALIGSMFTVGFMCFMHYDDMYFAGVKEGIRVRAEGGKIDIFKGLKIALLAYSPIILIGIVTVILHLCGSEAAAGSLFVYYIFQGSFLGLYKIRIVMGVVAYIVITLLPALIAGALGYGLGLKDKTIRGLFGMKVKPPYDGPLERKPKNNNKN